MSAIALPNCSARLAERNTMIGASEAPSILGVGYDPLAVWARKTGRLPASEEESELLECGTVLQPAILELLRRRAKFAIVDEPAWQVRRHDHLIWLGCSLDAFVEDDPRGLGVVEAKNVGSYNAKEWKEAEPPLRHNVQIQTQMVVTGAAWGVVVGLIGGNRLVWHEVERDDVFIDRMVRALGEFWRLVEEDTPPPVDDSEYTARILARMYPIDDGSAIALPAESAEWDEERVTVKSEIKRLEERERWLDNQFKAALGEASEGLLPGGGRYTYKAQTRKEYVCPESTFRVLRRSAK